MALTIRQMTLKYLMNGFKKGIYWELLCMIPFTKLWDRKVQNQDKYCLLVLMIISNFL